MKNPAYDVNCPTCDTMAHGSCYERTKRGPLKAVHPHKERFVRAAEMAGLRDVIERRQAVTMWGQKRFVTPRLCSTVFGNGLRLIYFTPINTRPNWYIIRVDSRWSLSNWETNPRLKAPYDWVDDVCEALEDEFGRPEDEDGKRRADAKWPCADLDTGFSWGEEPWPKGLDPNGEDPARKGKEKAG